MALLQGRILFLLFEKIKAFKAVILTFFNLIIINYVAGSRYEVHR
jgi:hypothetical protein